MDKLCIITFIFTVTTYGQLPDVDFYGPDNLMEGDDILISCYFASRPPGTPKWRLSQKGYTEQCNVTVRDGTLKESDTCYGDNIIGNPANYTFELLNISYKRDGWKKWNCYLTSAVYLDLEIGIEAGRLDFINQCETFKAKKDVEMIAKTDCFFPSSEIEWCVRIGDNDKCSDTHSDYWIDVFYSEPLITITDNSSCPEYNDEFVRQITSTLSGTTAEANANLAAAVIYPKVGSVSPTDPCMQILLEKPCPVVLTSVAICICVIVVIVAIVLLVLDQMKLNQDSSNNRTSHVRESISDFKFHIGCVVCAIVAVIVLLAALVMNIQTECLWGIIVCVILMVLLVVIISIIGYKIYAALHEEEDDNQRYPMPDYPNTGKKTSNEVKPEIRNSLKGIPIQEVDTPRKLPRL